MFAAGVILFVMFSLSPPFMKAIIDDSYYKQIATNKWRIFWNAHEKNKVEGYFSDDFKSLMTCVLAYDPAYRLSLSELLAHPWCQGESVSQEELFD